MIDVKGVAGGQQGRGRRKEGGKQTDLCFGKAHGFKLSRIGSSEEPPTYNHGADPYRLFIFHLLLPAQIIGECEHNKRCTMWVRAVVTSVDGICSYWLCEGS